jgi:hypothetical protein
VSSPSAASNPQSQGGVTVADRTLPEIPAGDGGALAALEAELEAMKRRICEISNVAIP